MTRTAGVVRSSLSRDQVKRSGAHGFDLRLQRFVVRIGTAKILGKAPHETLVGAFLLHGLIGTGWKAASARTSQLGCGSRQLLVHPAVQVPLPVPDYASNAGECRTVAAQAAFGEG